MLGFCGYSGSASGRSEVETKGVGLIYRPVRLAVDILRNRHFFGLAGRALRDPGRVKFLAQRIGDVADVTGGSRGLCIGELREGFVRRGIVGVETCDMR